MVEHVGRRAALVSVLALFAACSTDTHTTAGGGSFTPIGSIALVPAAATLQVGETLAVSATVTAAAGGTLAGVALTWSTSNSTVATIDQSGKVVAVAAGEADIAAAAQGISGSAHLKVVPPAPAMVTLSVSITGSGAVTGPGGFNCASGTCTANFAKGTTVALEAAAASGSVFSAWGGACTGAGPCSVVLSSTQSVSAAFEPAGARHTVTVAISGSGTVTSSSPGLSCSGAGSTCSAIFTTGASLSLVATPAAGFFFGGWTGAGCGAASACDLTVTSDLNLTAAFTAGATLSVAVVGSGSVVSTPAAIACPGTCASALPLGSNVTLSATPSSGFAFTGWSGGGCSGTLPCTLALTAAASVTATFTAEPILTVVVHGAGTVSSSPAGISCVEGGASCSAPFAAGTPIVLTEQPGASLQFGGWGGACAGAASTCAITLGSSTSATAQFGTFYALTFTTTGNGTVSADSGALQACGASSGVCAGNYLAGSLVVLTATPATGAALSGWSGACSAASGGQCTLTMSAAASAGAGFSDAATLSAVSGGGQSALIDAALPLPLVIHAVDNNGGANVPGATVSLSGPPGASVVPASVATDAQGNATFHVRLSRIVGTQTFTARTQAAPPLTITATATEPAPGTIFTVVNASHNKGFDGFPGAATTAHLRTPAGLAMANDGTLYIGDYDGNAIFALSPAGALTVVAGTGACGYSGDNGPALAARFCQPLDLALDETLGRRTLYVADIASSVIRAIDLTLPAPTISTFAGGGSPVGPGFGDGGAATQASLSAPGRISVGPDGYLYIADVGRNRIRRVNLASQLIENWISGDTSFCRFNACAVSWDAAGRAFVTRNLGYYYFDLFRVGADFSFTTVAGGYGSAGDNGIYPTSSVLYEPTPARFDGAGNLFITEQGYYRPGGEDVRRVDLATGKIATIAGNGTPGYLGDYVPATQAELQTPWTSVFDANGNLYVADADNASVRLVWKAGQAAPVRSSIAKTGGDLQQAGVDQITPMMSVTLSDPNGQPLSGYPVQWQSIDPGGVIFAGLVGTDTSGVAAADGRVGLNQGGTWRYTASAFDFHGEALAGSPITFQDTSVDLPARTFFTAVNTSHTQAVSGIPGSATAAQIPHPTALAMAADGTLYLAASDNIANFIFALSPAGVLTLIAGTGPCGASGDSGPALAARLCSQTDLALDETHGRRMLYVTDTQNWLVRGINLLATPPTIDRVAGGGNATASPWGDGALATEATLSDPEHIAIDPSGAYLYVSEYGGGRTRIRRVSLTTGIITTWLPLADAGCAQSACKLAFSPPDQTHPNGMAFFTVGFGSYYFGIYRIDDPTTPTSNVEIAGQSERFQVSADGPAITQYPYPGDLLVGPDHRLYTTDPFSHRVRVFSDATSATGTMTTLAGVATSTGGNGADGPVATSVNLNTPTSIAFSPNGSLLVADSFNSTIRVLWKLLP